MTSTECLYYMSCRGVIFFYWLKEEKPSLKCLNSKLKYIESYEHILKFTVLPINNDRATVWSDQFARLLR